ncbi:MAG TPA: acyltransferase [Caulobacterales bacterium]|nr:acyltransferase [Caulobacterales bacterium]
MPRFPEIEGLRAWLAWSVVATHCFVSLNYFPRVGQLLDGGNIVAVFIMVSGFVIAGLVIDKQETWPRYILRRAFRIFPAYLVALPIGAFAVHLAVAGLATTAWGSDASSWFYGARSGEVEQVAQNPWPYWLLHVTLLQGLAPDNILPWSSVAFIGPAWSLSLEWQFYLIAPALIWLLRSRRWAALATLIAFAGAYLFKHQVFGVYSNYANLAGGLWLFVIGIASRLALPALKAMLPPFSAIAIAAAGFIPFANGIAPVLFWIAFVAFLARPPKQEFLADRVASGFAGMLFASWLPRTLGARSYSVYVLHMPLLDILLYLLPLHALTQVQAFALLAPSVAVSTLIASELMYRFVERPMIRLGAQLAAPRLAPRPLESAQTAP